MILSEAFILGVISWKNDTQFYRNTGNPQNSAVNTTGAFYESGINFWTFTYDTILPNKFMNIFINYGLSLNDNWPLREHTIFMKVLFSVSQKLFSMVIFLTNQKRDMPLHSPSTKLQLFGLTVCPDELLGHFELIQFVGYDIPEGCSISHLPTWSQ